MPRILLATSFIDSLSDLDSSDAKRVAQFLEKLVRAPEAASLRPEIVHDASDRAVRSFKVTHDLRAIAYVGNEIVLLFAARHDRAYAWARDRCISCHPMTGTVEIGEREGEGEPITAIACALPEEICRLIGLADS